MTTTYNLPLPRCHNCGRFLAGREAELCKHCLHAYHFGFRDGWQAANADTTTEAEA